MANTIVAANAGSWTGTGAPVVSASWTPLENDLVLVFLGSAASDITTSPVAGWPELVPVVDPADTSMSMQGLSHLITSGEASANTTSFTLTDVWGGSPRSQDWLVLVVRGVDPADPIDLAVSGFQAGTTSPFPLPALPGASLSTGSLVVYAIFSDAAARTYTTPAGTTQQAISNVYCGGWLGTRDALTVSGVDVPSINIVPDAGDEFCAISVAIKAAGDSNAPPIADAGTDEANLEPFATATLDGSGSTDSDGTIVSYAWTQTDGPTVTLIDDDTANCTYVVPATLEGDTATFLLTVTDDEADTGTDSVTHTWLPHTWWLVTDGEASEPIRATLID